MTDTHPDPAAAATAHTSPRASAACAGHQQSSRQLHRLSPLGAVNRASSPWVPNPQQQQQKLQDKTAALSSQAQQQQEQRRQQEQQAAQERLQQLQHKEALTTEEKREKQ